MRTSRRVELNDDDRAELERIVRSPTTEQRVALRGRIVLLSTEGVGTGSIAERLGHDDLDDHTLARPVREGGSARTPQGRAPVRATSDDQQGAGGRGCAADAR